MLAEQPSAQPFREWSAPRQLQPDKQKPEYDEGGDNQNQSHGPEYIILGSLKWLSAKIQTETLPQLDAADAR